MNLAECIRKSVGESNFGFALELRRNFEYPSRYGLGRYALA